MHFCIKVSTRTAVCHKNVPASNSVFGGGAQRRCIGWTVDLNPSSQVLQLPLTKAVEMFPLAIGCLISSHVWSQMG